MLLCVLDLFERMNKHIFYFPFEMFLVLSEGTLVGYM